MNYLETMKNNIKNWFSERHIDCAVVGFSGGIDSATTAALLAKSGIPVVLVQVHASCQKYSSDYSPYEFAVKYKDMDVESIDIWRPEGRSSFLSDYPIGGFSKQYSAFLEASLPILRVGAFYGVVAALKTKGKNPIVVGTTNFDEASYLGFFGKSSDAAQDFYPISHLHKSNVYDIASKLNVPQEIIDAIPSGDLQYSGDLNDAKMIGATYDEIEAISFCAETNDFTNIYDIILSIENPDLFIDNVIRNDFKYQLPFPNFHLYPRLENFRQKHYEKILNVCKHIKRERNA